jgi:hypothetical protein
VRRVSDTIPTQHTAGDTFEATLSGADYPPASGWGAQLVLIGPARHTITATTSGTDFAATALASATASWPAGDYVTRVVYTNGLQRVTGGPGALRVLPDPTSGATDAESLKGTAQRRLDDLQAVYDAHIASGNAMVGEYTINGRTMRYRDLSELLAAINAAKRDVQSEQAASRVAAGLSPRVRYVTRM